MAVRFLFKFGARCHRFQTTQGARSGFFAPPDRHEQPGRLLYRFVRSPGGSKRGTMGRKYLNWPDQARDCTLRPVARSLMATRMARRMGLAAILVSALTAHPKCFAGADWLVDAWRVEDGLPDNIVDAITQTPDGYLWLGTQGGLVRFDGVHFSTVDDPTFKIEQVHQ